MSQDVRVEHLDEVDAVNLVLQANGEMVMGRTALQKLVYFVSERIDNSKIDFVPHLFGPYSAWVSAILAEMYSNGHVYELPEPMNGYTIYRYGLTPPGNIQANEIRKLHPNTTMQIIQDIVDICNRECQLNANKLAYAAKIHFVHQNHEGVDLPPLSTDEEICKAAGKFGWTMNLDNVKTGFEILQSLKLDPRR